MNIMTKCANCMKSLLNTNKNNDYKQMTVALYGKAICVKVIAVSDSRESSWSLSGNAVSQAGRCPGQQWVKLIAVSNSSESSWSLFRTAVSQAGRCPGQHCNECLFLSALLDVAVTSFSVCVLYFSGMNTVISKLNGNLVILYTHQYCV